jgi:Flp pilus assembly protein TadD
LATKTQEFTEGTFESRELFRKAEIFIQRADYKGATSLLNAALKIAPENPVYMSHLGLCIGMLGNRMLGEKLCRKAIMLSPTSPILFVNMGRILLEQGNRQEAREQFMHAYKLDNTSAPAALELSRMGVRRRPVIPFLKRGNSLNILLGKFRAWLLLHKQRLKKR